MPRDAVPKGINKAEEAAVRSLLENDKFLEASDNAIKAHMPEEGFKKIMIDVLTKKAQEGNSNPVVPAMLFRKYTKITSSDIEDIIWAVESKQFLSTGSDPDKDALLSNTKVHLEALHAYLEQLEERTELESISRSFYADL